MGFVIQIQIIFLEIWDANRKILIITQLLLEQTEDHCGFDARNSHVEKGG